MKKIPLGVGILVFVAAGAYSVPYHKETVRGTYHEESTRRWVVLHGEETGVGFEPGPTACGPNNSSTRWQLKLGFFALEQENAWWDTRR